MKTIISAAVLIMLFATCTKKDMQPSATVSASSNDNSAIKKATQILTSHQWMYNAFYMHYID